LDVGGLSGDFLTIVGTIFIAELTDKDALLLLSLGTRMRPFLVFAAGSIAFTISSVVIVLVGSVLIEHVPIFWVKIAGGVIMLAYAVLEYLRGLRIEESAEQKEQRFVKTLGRKELFAFIGIIGSLIILDLAGDGTELVTVIFVAQFRNSLLVFIGAVIALVAASAVETTLGNRIGKFLSGKAIRRLSVVLFLIIGSIIILSSGII
jgi:putative Ca2+/H+ antiporter (TMEM165/GDT1 family)